MRGDVMQYVYNVGVLVPLAGFFVFAWIVRLAKQSAPKPTAAPVLVHTQAPPQPQPAPPQKREQPTPAPSAPQYQQPIKQTRTSDQRAIEGMKWREVYGRPRATVWRDAMIDRRRAQRARIDRAQSTDESMRAQ